MQLQSSVPAHVPTAEGLRTAVVVTRTRQGSHAGRSIGNSAELVQLAIQVLGGHLQVFEFVRLESFADHAVAFQRTVVMMGMEGAGLTNIVHMPAGGHVIELSTNPYPSVFWEAGHGLDLIWWHFEVRWDATDETHLVDLGRMRKLLPCVLKAAQLRRLDFNTAHVLARLVDREDEG